MTAVILSALASHWRRNLLQLLTLLVGLALATALWSGVQAINAEARASYDTAAETLGEGQFAQITSVDGGAMSQQIYIALRRAGWMVSPVTEGRLGPVRIIGLEPLTAPGGLVRSASTAVAISQHSCQGRPDIRAPAYACAAAGHGGGRRCCPGCGTRYGDHRYRTGAAPAEAPGSGRPPDRASRSTLDPPPSGRGGP